MFLGIKNVLAMDLDLIQKEVTTNLLPYQDKVKISSNDNTLNIIFTENVENGNPLIIDTKFVLKNEMLEYQFSNKNENEIYYFKESLIRNLIIESVIKAIGKLNNYSLDQINLFLINMTELNPKLKTHGLEFKAAPYQYSRFNLTGESDIALNVYIENITNYGKGNNSYEKVLNFPVEGYEYNVSKSKCENNSGLQLLNANKLDMSIRIISRQQDDCNVYFSESNLFPYDLTLNASIIKQLSIDLKNFNPANLQANVDNDENNPNTGIFLPITLLVFLGLSSGLLFYFIKKKQIIYKI